MTVAESMMDGVQARKVGWRWRGGGKLPCRAASATHLILGLHPILGHVALELGLLGLGTTPAGRVARRLGLRGPQRRVHLAKREQLALKVHLRTGRRVPAR